MAATRTAPAAVGKLAKAASNALASAGAKLTGDEPAAATDTVAEVVEVVPPTVVPKAQATVLLRAYRKAEKRAGAAKDALDAAKAAIVEAMGPADVLQVAETGKTVAEIKTVESLVFEQTRYRAEHATIAPARQFKLADADYQKFVQFVSAKDINYSTDMEKSLASLTKQAKAEKHYDDVKTELEAIRKKVSTNKANDLARFKPEIREMLEQEIVSRYYFQKGQIEATFDDDPDILMAMNVLNDQPRYLALLKPGTPESKTRPDAKKNGK